MIDANALQYAVPNRETEAVDRLSRLHGALELKATLLALLLPIDSRRAARAYEIETADIRQAPTLRPLVLSLPGGARLPWFEMLLGRMALQPLGLRQDLLQATRRIMGARGMARAVDRLHWLTMRRLLGEPLAFRPRGSATADVSEWLDTDLIAIAIYSAFLSRMIPVDAAETTAPAGRDLGAEWYALVLEPWQGGSELPGCQPPDGEGAIRALNTLQTLSMMQRPLVIRGWLGAAVDNGRFGALTDSAADALRLTCGLLDTPMPPELARHFTELAPKP
jgi:hypothetical protein